MANVFSTDPNCVALYRLENGAMTTDSIGSNTMTLVNGGPSADVADFQEGAACGDFERDNDEGLSCADANLDAGFPGSYGETTNFMSVCAWVKYETVAGYAIASIWHHLNYGFRAWRLWGEPTKFSFQIHRGSAYYCGVDHSISVVAGRWYHVGATFDDPHNIVRLRVYDDFAGTASSTESVGGNVNMLLQNASYFRIGGYPGFGGGDQNWIDAKIDEVVIFKDVISDDEIDAIRQGHFGDWIFLSGRSNAVTTLTGSLAGPVNMCLDLAQFHPETNVKEQLHWRTDIIKGADGSEQRLATRRPPRQRFAMPYILRNATDGARAQAMLHKWASRQWGCPVWSDRVITHATLSATDTTINIDTTASDFRADSFGLVWQPDQYEVIDISSVSASALTLSSGLVNDYTGETFIIPYRRARLYQPPRRNRLQGGGSILEMFFEVVDNAEISGWSAADTYDSMDILTTPGYLQTAFYTEQHDPDVRILDGLTGKVDVVKISDFNIVDQPHVLIARSAAEAWAHRQFLHAACGRQKKFLVPTFTQDFVLTRQVGAADTTIYVSNIGLAAHMGANDLRKYIGFRNNGTLIVRRITGMAQVDATEESLDLDAAVGTIMPTNSLVCWVDICHLASDRVDIQWHLPGVCSIPLRLIRVI